MLDKGARRWEAANKRCTEFRLAKFFGQEKVLTKSVFLGTYFTQQKNWRADSSQGQKIL